jgi:uncharacterized protein (DUF1330 family)
MFTKCIVGFGLYLITYQIYAQITPSPVPNPVAISKPLDPFVCDNLPVLMVISGLIHDRVRLAVYAKAIRDSGLYPLLGGYYMNNPRAVATFEGAPPENASTLIVRFPCFAHARSFWYSKLYQEKIVPARSNPPAGTFTVTIYEENGLPPYMIGRVDSGKYSTPQVETIVSGIEKIPTFAIIPKK